MNALVLIAASLLMAACSVAGSTASASVDAPEPSTVYPAASPTPTPTLVVEPPPWPPEPTHDARFVPIGGLELSDDGRQIKLDFTGDAAFSPDDPCSADYSATTAVADGVLEVGIFQSRPPRPEEPRPCDAIGFGRSLDVELSEPFTGSAWRDLYGPYLHFLAPPEGLVELTGLPVGWALRAERDVEESPTGRWERTYSPDASLADRTKTVTLYQSFGGPVNVTGGTEERQVEVNGQNATLYRWPPNGELVLVWRLGNDGLALVAYESEFSTDELIDLAASASPPDASAPTVGTWGPLAVLPPQDGMDTLRAEGSLRTTDTCVYLEAHGQVYLLFWHADQVTWNEGSRTITFENFPWNDDGKIVTVSDGDRVVIGGSGGGDEEGGESSEEFVSRMDWVAPPASSCSLDPWWSVGAVQK